MTSTATATIDARLSRRRRAVAAALAVAAATTVITGCAHSLGGGSAPDALLLATAFVATLLVLAPVLAPAGGRRSPGGRLVRQVAAVAVAQLLQHVLYALPERASSMPTHEHAHLHDAVAAMHAAAVVHEHASMPLAHAAAGLGTLALLRLAPRAVDALLAAMSLRLVAAVLAWTPAPEPARASVAAASAPRRASLDVLRSAQSRRGPPLALV